MEGMSLVYREGTGGLSKWPTLTLPGLEPSLTGQWCRLLTAPHTAFESPVWGTLAGPLVQPSLHRREPGAQRREKTANW